VNRYHRLLTTVLLSAVSQEKAGSPLVVVPEMLSTGVK